MQKNSLRPIPCKQIVYEEDFSIDQMSFASQKSPPSLPVTTHKSPHSLIHSFLSKHNSSPSSYSKMIITTIVNKQHSISLMRYNEMKINSSEQSALKRFYSLQESIVRIPKFELYYKHYIKYLAKPTFNSEAMNILIHDTAKEKAQLYFDMAYGRGKKQCQKEKNDNIEDIIFDSNIKETIDNYSTTMTCDSNEQLMYPSEIYKKCNAISNPNMLIKVNDNNVDFSESEIVNSKSKSNLFIQNENDFDNNESIVVIMNDLKNKSRSKSKSKLTSRYKTQTNLNRKYQNISLNKKKSFTKTMPLKQSNYSIDKSKKISFITINPSKQNQSKYKSNCLIKSYNPQSISKLSTKILNSKPSTNRKTKHFQLHTLQQLPSTVLNINTLYKTYTSSYKSRRLSEIETKNKTSNNNSQRNNETNTSKNHRYKSEFFKLFDVNKSKSPHKSKEKIKVKYYTHGSSNSNNINTNVSSNVCYKELYKHKKDFFHNNNNQ